MNIKEILTTIISLFFIGTSLIYYNYINLSNVQDLINNNNFIYITGSISCLYLLKYLNLVNNKLLILIIFMTMLLIKKRDY
jgi:hypothetical protein